MLCLTIVPIHVNEYIIIMFTNVVYARCFSIICTNNIYTCYITFYDFFVLFLFVITKQIHKA